MENLGMDVSLNAEKSNMAPWANGFTEPLRVVNSGEVASLPPAAGPKPALLASRVRKKGEEGAMPSMPPSLGAFQEETETYASQLHKTTRAVVAEAMDALERRLRNKRAEIPPHSRTHWEICEVQMGEELRGFRGKLEALLDTLANSTHALLAKAGQIGDAMQASLEGRMGASKTQYDQYLRDERSRTYQTEQRLEQSITARLRREFKVESERAREEADQLKEQLREAKLAVDASEASRLRQELHRMRMEHQKEGERWAMERMAMMEDPDQTLNPKP